MSEEKMQRLSYSPQGMTKSNRGFYVHYADYIKLETELQDTRKALELMCIDYRSMEMADGVNKNLSTVEEYMGYARGERAER